MTHKKSYSFIRFVSITSIVILTIGFISLTVPTTYKVLHIFWTGKTIQVIKTQNEKSVVQSNSENQTLMMAIEQVKQKGYSVGDGNNFGYDELSSLNVLIGTATGSADGYNKRAFFFYRGKYLETNDTDGAQLEVAWRNDNTIALNYILYNKDDPLCCPTAGGAIVRFQWNGERIIALDPIPTSDWSVDAHR